MAIDPQSAADHPYLQVVGRDILRYTAGAKVAGKQPIVRAVWCFDLISEIAKWCGAGSAGAAVTSWYHSVAGQTLTIISTVIASLIWLCWKFVMKDRDWVARAAAARACSADTRAIWSRLTQALDTSEPDCTDLKREVSVIWDRAARAGALPWDPPYPTGARFEREFQRQVEIIRMNHMNLWAAPPATDRRD